MNAPHQTVRPYPPGTQWTFQSRRTGYVKTIELALLPEPDGSPMSDDYTPDEMSARELWAMWVKKYADVEHENRPADYDPGEVRIYWSVTSVGDGDGVFELAPHSYDARATRTASFMPQDNFDTFYTPPVHTVTGESLSWLRLPVLDCGWNSTAADKGGFIQEATGWRTSSGRGTPSATGAAWPASSRAPRTPCRCRTDLGGAPFCAPDRSWSGAQSSLEGVTDPGVSVAGAHTRPTVGRLPVHAQKNESDRE